ncbi:MAG: sensor histidine kinase, partial [Micromonosporaceae bacterium]
MTTPTQGPTARSTPRYLHAVFMLLGSALAVSFVMVDLVLSVTVVNQKPSTPVLIAATVVIVGVPPVLLGLMSPVRQVEAVAAESLLGVRFPDGTPGPARTLEQRLRAMVWFLAHVVAGGVVAAGLVLLLSLGPALIVAPLTLPAGGEVLGLSWLRTSGGWADAWLVAVGTAGVLVALLLPFALGAVMARFAPLLLGPSYAERLHRLEAETARLVERNRIARELHDSVGHALSLITVQAGAAGKLLARDPGFAAEALRAIESASRSATGELDHMLGLLREGEAAARAPAPELSALPELLAATRTAGLEVTAELDGDLDTVPGVVSREAYRIVQEGLTNALRYATGEARLSVTRRDGALRLE